jgi:hypothetical protein
VYLWNVRIFNLCSQHVLLCYSDIFELAHSVTTLPSPEVGTVHRCVRIFYMYANNIWPWIHSHKHVWFLQVIDSQKWCIRVKAKKLAVARSWAICMKWHVQASYLCVYFDQGLFVHRLAMVWLSVALICVPDFLRGIRNHFKFIPTHFKHHAVRLHNIQPI